MDWHGSEKRKFKLSWFIHRLTSLFNGFLLYAFSLWACSIRKDMHPRKGEVQLALASFHLLLLQASVGQVKKKKPGYFFSKKRRKKKEEKEPGTLFYMCADPQ